MRTLLVLINNKLHSFSDAKKQSNVWGQFQLLLVRPLLSLMDVLLAATQKKKRTKNMWTKGCTLQEEEGVNIPTVPPLGVETAVEPQIHK